MTFDVVGTFETCPRNRSPGFPHSCRTVHHQYVNLKIFICLRIFNNTGSVDKSVVFGSMSLSFTRPVPVNPSPGTGLGLDKGDTPVQRPTRTYS